jgi:serine-type D-Ala-D-Ala carboxypeptidase/endopeptidase (penicillin-binding protein 4)
MKYWIGKFAAWHALSFATLLFAAGVSGQTARPFLQDIQVQSDPAPVVSATPLVKKTGSASSLAPAGSASSVRTSIPVLAEVAIPGYSGVLVESLNGETVVESFPDTPFNPASNVKLATAFAVLKTFGPDYRFPTSVWTDGAFEEATNTIHGNIYISGRDPVFAFEHAVAIASELNRMGIKVVKGDLIVTDNFSMNQAAPQRSSQLLFSTLDASKRSGAAATAWTNFLVNSGRTAQNTSNPGVSFTGGVYVQPMPGNVNLLFSHESPRMRDILKVTLCYSNNFLSERLGEMVGGPYAVARLVQQHAGALPNEFMLQTSSGLGINRVTPNAMMKLLRALRRDLSSYNMSFADIMPVAGIDKGTLEHRFQSDFSIGSVVGKTGTLGNTDGGASSLAGEINTRGGRLLFVIFNQKGSVARFRSFQNNYVSIIQGQFGGAASLSYKEIPMNARLALTRISYPDGRSSGGGDN